MSRKKPEPGGRGPKRRRQKPLLDKLPDQRAMEGAMQQLVAGLQGRADQDTPLGQAQALIYRAFEEPNEQRRVRLAQDALAISPDCADAYVLLAEHAPSRQEALRRYELDATFNEMCARVCGKPPPGLLDMPGVNPAQVGSFYEAVACFFRQAGRFFLDAGRRRGWDGSTRLSLMFAAYWRPL
jgi:hypothetical protein